MLGEADCFEYGDYTRRGIVVKREEIRGNTCENGRNSSLKVKEIYKARTICLVYKARFDVIVCSIRKHLMEHSAGTVILRKFFEYLTYYLSLLSSDHSSLKPDSFILLHE